jgi:hypothetical protein
MLIDQFQITNYKSFRVSEPIQLSVGFNVFIGKNNSGKTALLEAISLSTLANKPHRHSGIPHGNPLKPTSSVELTVTLTPNDLRLAALNVGAFWFPVPKDLPGDQYLTLPDQYLKQPHQFRFAVGPGGSIGGSHYPSHAMFQGPPTGLSVEFHVNEERSGFRIGTVASSDNDNFFVAVGRLLIESIYSFRAERLSLASYQYGDSPTLLSDARNLAVVLNILQGQHQRFERFNSLVNRVFPSIRRISVRPRSVNFEIMIWNADAPADRDDLAIELAESGTGIGQVLAMLYIIVTSKSPRIIVIDEPNIFLHPGAIRQLVEIMREDRTGHQYVITTHSPDIIRATETERLYVVERREEESHVTRISPDDVGNFRRALLEVGARLSDLFGADNIIWVEGSTEEECFPKIMRASSGFKPGGLAVIAVRATGDFDGGRAPARAIWEIYNRLSTSGSLMPATLAISLDSEGRSENDIEGAKEASRGLIHFLPRRCFENYLIHPGAIAAVLNSLPTFAAAPTAGHSVEAWLQANGGSAKYKGGKFWNGDAFDMRWLVAIRGALLLHDLFSDLSSAKEEYRKVEHGVALTEWICEFDSKHFSDLARYLQELIE